MPGVSARLRKVFGQKIIPGKTVKAILDQARRELWTAGSLRSDPIKLHAVGRFGVQNLQCPRPRNRAQGLPLDRSNQIGG